MPIQRIAGCAGAFGTLARNNSPILRQTEELRRWRRAEIVGADIVEAAGAHGALVPYLFLIQSEEKKSGPILSAFAGNLES